MNIKKIFITLSIVGILSASIFTSAEELTGKDIFLNRKCNNCHSIKSQGIESKQAGKYPDLSTIGNQEFTSEFLHKYLVREEKINNKTHPFKFNGEAAELDSLVNWLQTLK
ncbi:MAG TPA: c-type cytochrome [Bacteroidota bacterium]|nr:c-type cytochrome [Candidatus Kapabacteria bacterium]HRS01552.1 c-type cytochrome [Bacteroidota bacterium]